MGANSKLNSTHSVSIIISIMDVLTFVSSYTALPQSRSPHFPFPSPTQALFLFSFSRPQNPRILDQADHSVRWQAAGSAWGQGNTYILKKLWVVFTNLLAAVCFFGNNNLGLVGVEAAIIWVIRVVLTNLLSLEPCPTIICSKNTNFLRLNITTHTSLLSLRALRCNLQALSPDHFHLLSPQ